jgi:photosystem II stability/assembly factor-like uncharacterized protein
MKILQILGISLVLTVLLFQSLRAQTDWEILFQEDFEDGSTDGWIFDPLYGDAEFHVETENNGYVLSGSGHGHAVLPAGHQNNYSLKTDVKLIDGNGGVQFNYRVHKDERYFIGFFSNTISLGKSESGGNHNNLVSVDEQNQTGQWYVVEIVGFENNIKVYIDGINKINYTDTSHIDGGTSEFETLDNSHVHFDNIIISGEKPSTIEVEWIRTGGPNGGLGYDVRIHPENKNIMFVTDNPSGVNKSYDGGDTWDQRNTGISIRAGASSDGIPIFSLTIDPGNSNIVWAGTQNAKGIFKSTDWGETWTRKDNGVIEGDEISFRNFGIHPNNSDIVFGGAEIATDILGREFDKTRGKIYKTEDSGENWRTVWEGDNLVRFILFDYVHPDTMYASTGIFDREAYNGEGVGILKSTDTGETWFQINNGIPNTEGNRFTGFLEMDPYNPRILYTASGNNALGSGGVFKTTNGGKNWIQVLTKGVFTVVTISPSNTNIVYAGGAHAFYRSDNGGTQWQMFMMEHGGYGPPGIRAGVPISAVVDPEDPYTVFANNYGGGNFKSTDGCSTWINSSKGYTGADLHDITMDVNNPTVVYTIGRSGPFRSFNSGADWTGISFPPAVEAEWYAVALNPLNSKEVLISDEFTGLIWKSTDRGNSWEIVYKHPDVTEGDPQEARHGFKDIIFAPSDPTIVYAGMSKGRRSIDGDFPPRSSFGMCKSTNSGDNWFKINNGLNTSFMNIHVVEVDPKDHDIVYIGTWRDGLFKTTDGGGTWNLKSNGLTSSDVRSIEIDPNNTDIIYAGLGEGGGILKSTNGGELWAEINSGLSIECPPYLLPVGKVTQNMTLTKIPRRIVGADYYSVPWTSVRSIVIDPTNSQTIYAADYLTGVYMSSNGGNTWNIVNKGLSTRAVTSLAISADGKVLYASSSGEGVFRLVLKNYAPEILSTVPLADSTVSINQGDSLGFSVIVHDLNNDTLSYSWTLNSSPIEGEAGSSYLLKTSDLVQGNYLLAVQVGDIDTSIVVNWNIEIIHPTEIKDNEFTGLPKTFALLQNYPNPFNPDTRIEYWIPVTSNVTVKVYNIQGQIVKTLVDGKKEAGYFTTTWNSKDAQGNHAATGVYVYKMKAVTRMQHIVKIRKMVLLR